MSDSVIHVFAFKWTTSCQTKLIKYNISQVQQNSFFKNKSQHHQFGSYIQPVGYPKRPIVVNQSLLSFLNVVRSQRSNTRVPPRPVSGKSTPLMTNRWSHGCNFRRPYPRIRERRRSKYSPEWVTSQQLPNRFERQFQLDLNSNISTIMINFKFLPIAMATKIKSAYIFQVFAFGVKHDILFCFYTNFVLQVMEYFF